MVMQMQIQGGGASTPPTVHSAPLGAQDALPQLLSTAGKSLVYPLHHPVGECSHHGERLGVARKLRLIK
jgi:hypothetical protein